ncbi:hypothetical protein MKK63_10185 [Methylobacterium sp. J-088]|uniref:hypothetical protein n=1 Tax=Methylobacterium sp. J-088 TaxID=2836664 RepID=UPI001FB87C56|nr:hypothetical protein [Methylobacterium sp. J-088]MCJ2063077.1 hypothetical protein [Methylobacterium sp. J-088]
MKDFTELGAQPHCHGHDAPLALVAESSGGPALIVGLLLFLGLGAGVYSYTVRNAA